MNVANAGCCTKGYLWCYYALHQPATVVSRSASRTPSLSRPFHIRKAFYKHSKNCRTDYFLSICRLPQQPTSAQKHHHVNSSCTRYLSREDVLGYSPTLPEETSRCYSGMMVKYLSLHRSFTLLHLLVPWELDSMSFGIKPLLTPLQSVCKQCKYRTGFTSTFAPKYCQTVPLRINLPPQAIF